MTRMRMVLGIARENKRHAFDRRRRYSGRSGIALMGIVKAFELAESIVRDNVPIEPMEIDVLHWLGNWIECPQPMLGKIKAVVVRSRSFPLVS